MPQLPDTARRVPAHLHTTPGTAGDPLNSTHCEHAHARLLAQRLAAWHHAREEMRVPASWYAAAGAAAALVWLLHAALRAGGAA